jgi:hydroxylamine reductase (hybrid-cluster protein)
MKPDILAVEKLPPVLGSGPCGSCGSVQLALRLAARLSSGRP